MPSSMLATVKSELSFTVTCDPSDFVMCASKAAPSASVSTRSIVPSGTAVCAAAVALVASSPVSTCSVMPLALCGPPPPGPPRPSAGGVVGASAGGGGGGGGGQGGWGARRPVWGGAPRGAAPLEG